MEKARTGQLATNAFENRNLCHCSNGAEFIARQAFDYLSPPENFSAPATEAFKRLDNRGTERRTRELLRRARVAEPQLATSYPTLRRSPRHRIRTLTCDLNRELNSD